MQTPTRSPAPNPCGRADESPAPPPEKNWEDVANPTIQEPTDVIAKVDTTTICGTDLHILKGHVPAVTDGRILGHEAIGSITEVGAAVTALSVGDRIIIPAGRLNARAMATHHFKLPEIMEAYEVFGNAAKNKVIKVVITAE